MNKLPANNLGEHIEYRNLQILTESIVEEGYTHSVQSIAALAGRICASVLSCDGGGIGVYDQSENRITLWIPVECYSEGAVLADHESKGPCTLNIELIHCWVDKRRMLFIDKTPQPRIWRCGRPEACGLEAENMILDGIFNQSDSMICFYTLANVDKSELQKYQIIMKLLLSSLFGTLLRLSVRRSTPAGDGGSLTEREHEIIAHIRAGLNNKTIARRLNISINTVKCHIYNIFQKLHASNRVEAILKAEQSGHVA